MASINRQKKYPVYILLMLLVGLGSCSTKKNSFTRRLFHNVTGHYNMFWNGRESYREGVADLNEKVEDNYNRVLTVYNYGTEQQATSMNPYMDKAIEKASLNIQRHSMYFNRKEYVRWIDDSYMLIGLGYFYKQEYNKARRTFDYVINEYKKNDIRYDAMLWLAKSYIELEKYKRAQSALDNLENEIKKNPKVSKKIILALPMVRADMYIKQEKTTQAIDPLLTAIRIPQKKTTLSRSMFILAQIYQQEGEYYRASDMYKQVIKKNPAYQMAFNAAINLATSYDTIYGESSKPIIKKLKKMLKEDKNIEYKDQIYYALADIAFKDGIDTLAINYLALSVATSVTNNYQKTTSALALGNIYFNVQKYRLAQAYYDTAVQVIPEDFPNKKDIELQTTYLTELVENLLVVITQDSLQRVAAMPEDERMALIEKIIEDVIKEEERQKELEELAALNTSTTSQLPGATGSSGGQWYFYNQLALSTGLNEFKKKWGNRKLEDNWRLSNKKSTFEPELDPVLTIPSDSTMIDSTGAVIVAKSNDPHSPDYYLQELPFTEEQVAASNKSIELALFNLGFIYKDKLFDNPASVESFETLIDRFPESEYLLQSYYQLYRLNILLENPDMVEYYKNLIVANFPDSDYAKLLTDPNFFKQLEAEKNRALTLYSETYDQYESGNYFTVYSNSTRALEEFETPEDILAKFEYLRALAIGKIEVVDSLQTALDTLIAKYPDSDVVPLAQNILDYLRGPIDSTGTGGGIKPKEVIDVSIYEFNPKSKQIFAMVVKSPVNVNALKVRISDYNNKFYNIESLAVTNILLDKSTHFVMVGNFETIESAMKYYNSLMSNEYVFASLEADQYNGFVIAQENYPIFYKDKDVKKYLAFFKQNYLKEK